jgi:hypothetical protein
MVAMQRMVAGQDRAVHGDSGGWQGIVAGRAGWQGRAGHYVWAWHCGRARHGGRAGKGMMAGQDMVASLGRA